MVTKRRCRSHDHRFFRLGVALFMDLFPPDVDHDAQVTHAIETPPPLWAVGRYWNDQVLHGFRALPSLDRGSTWPSGSRTWWPSRPRSSPRWPPSSTCRPTPSSAARAAALVRGAPSSRFPALSPAEQEELRAACLPGQVLLGRAEP